jgi:hypothetical protein
MYWLIVAVVFIANPLLGLILAFLGGVVARK